MLFLIFFYLSPVRAQTSPQGISLQGRIVDSSNNPLEDALVAFTVQIVSPGIEECVLYEELHNMNMTSSGGVFALPLGLGARAGTNFENTSTLAQVFNNSSGQINSLTCSSGTSYTPVANAKRKIKMTFDTGGGPQVVTQTLDIQAVPYALYADTLQGKAPANFLQTSAMTTQVKIDNLATTVNYNELLALIAGTSTNYTLANGGNFTPAADVDFNGKKIVDLAAPTAATDAVNKNYSDTKFGGANFDQTGLADGQSVRWNSGASKWEVYTPTSQWITTGSNIYYNTGNVGIGTATPGQKLTVNGTIESNGGILLNQGTAANDNMLFLGSSTPGKVDASMGFMAAGKGSSGDVDGPYFLARGNNFSNISNQRGNIYFAAGIPTTPSQSEGSVNFWTNGGSRMTVDRLGNVGIGTNSPGALLELSDGSNGAQFSLGTNGSLTVASTNAAGSISINPNNTLNLGTAATDVINLGRTTVNNFPIIFNTFGGETMRMVNGAVGIGTATPAAKLDVAGDIKFGNSSATCDILTEGSQRYNFVSDKMEVCINPGGWIELGGVPTSGGTFSGAVTVSSGGINVTGGVDNNSGGITEAGNISGVGNITGAGATTVSAGGTNQNLSLSSSGTGSVNVTTGNGTSLSVQDGGASTVNYVTIKGAPTGNAPIIGTAGGDANINLLFTPKGTGNSIFTSGSVGIGTATPSGTLHVYGTDPATASAGLVNFEGTARVNLLLRPASGFAQIVSNPATANTPFYITNNSGAIAFRPDLGVEVMRLTGGNVGIGTTTPSEKLTVQDGNIFATSLTTPSIVRAGEGPTANNIAMRFTPGLGNAAADISTQGQYHIILKPNDTERMRIDYATGNVGIGTTSPGAPLDVKGAIRLSGATSGYAGFQPAANAGSTVWTLPAADGSNGDALVTNGSGTLSWSSSGGTTDYAGTTCPAGQYMSGLDATGAATCTAPSNFSIFSGNSNNGTVNASSTVYAPLVGPFTMSATSTSTYTRTLISRAGIIQNLVIKTSAANSATKTNVYTIMLNGNPTTLTCSINAVTSCSDTDPAHAFAVVAGDEIEIQLVTDSASNTAVKHSWAVEIAF